MLHAFQSYWARPFFNRHPNHPLVIEDFELLTTILSALEWRRHNGSICMITDCAGQDYYTSLGLDMLWDDGINPILEKVIPNSLPPLIFWAAGKLYALRQMPTPCIMIDTDLIVWKNIEPYLQNFKLAVIHREAVHNDVYPPVSVLKTQCRFHPNLNWDGEACNTALAYFNDADFKYFYTKQAIDFMEHSPLADDPLIYMVFAEQRLLSVCADACGIPITALSDLPALFSSKQNSFTHTWGFKQQMRSQPSLRKNFCLRCLRRIAEDFPEIMPILIKIPVFSPYLKDLNIK